MLPPAFQAWNTAKSFEISFARLGVLDVVDIITPADLLLTDGKRSFGGSLKTLLTPLILGLKRPSLNATVSAEIRLAKKLRVFGLPAP